MAKPIRYCIVAGCSDRVCGHGYCRTHYQKWLWYGNPLAPDLKTRNGAPWRFIRHAIDYRGTDCLLWPFNKKVGRWGGYGLLRESPDSHHKLRAHVLVCSAVHKKPAGHKYQVAHSCGRPACINPAHLRWDTGKGNAADRKIHGTLVLGQMAWNAKLTEEQIRMIVALPRASRAIARDLGISWSHFLRIRKKERWAWLD